MIGIKSIAKRSGVSVATVSRVLNNSAMVNSETRQKVLETMGAINFKPKRLRRRIEAIGVAIPDFKPGRLNYTYIREFLAGVLEAASRFDTPVKVLDLDDVIHVADKPRAFNDFCREKGVSALVHIQTPTSFHGYIEKLADDGIPQVVIDHRFDRPDIAWIDLDDYRSSFQLAEYLVKLKCSSFAIISASRQFPGHSERHQGFTAALKNHGCSIPREWDVERQMVSVEAGNSATTSLLATSREVPRAIFYTNVELATGGIQSLAAHGLRQPEEVIVCLCDDSQFSQWTAQPVVYLSQPTFEIGTRTATYLLTHKAGETLREVIVPELFISSRVVELAKGNTRNSG
jgi:DNA-binding LacI/PurR family transcriptional regulator